MRSSVLVNCHQHRKANYNTAYAVQSHRETRVKRCRLRCTVLYHCTVQLIMPCCVFPVSLIACGQAGCVSVGTVRTRSTINISSILATNLVMLVSTMLYAVLLHAASSGWHWSTSTSKLYMYSPPRLADPLKTCLYILCAC